MHTYLCFLLALFVTGIFSHNHVGVGEVNIISSVSSMEEYVAIFLYEDQVYHIRQSVLYSYDILDESITEVFNFTAAELISTRAYSYIYGIEIVGDFLYMACNIYEDGEDDDFLISINLVEQTAIVHFYAEWTEEDKYLFAGEDGTVFASFCEYSFARAFVLKDGVLLQSTDDLLYGVSDFFLFADGAAMLNGEDSTDLVVLTKDNITSISILDDSLDFSIIFYSNDLNVIGYYESGNMTLFDINTLVFKSYPTTYNRNDLVVVGDKLYYESEEYNLTEFSLVTGVETQITNFDSRQYGLKKNDENLVRYSEGLLTVISLSDWSIRVANLSYFSDFVSITNELIIFENYISDVDTNLIVFALSDLSELNIVLPNTTSIYKWSPTNFNNFFVMEFGEYDTINGFATIQLLDCDAPFGGRLCLFNCDDCMNEGTCDSGIEGGICGCVEPFNGTFCEINTSQTAVDESEEEMNSEMESGDMTDVVETGDMTDAVDSGDMSNDDDTGDNPVDATTTLVACVAFTLVLFQ